ncbi:MAG TPA: RodZ domain-containing protein [Terriglobia bacterium]|nr:RodZ domain-containing protein [Terriglobia bacterium]
MDSMAGFGAGFRKAREAKGISIDGVAAETRIGARFLQAIESEDFAALPGGIFNRGFIRAYAERLGLDPDQAVEDYQRLVRDRETKEPEPASYRPPGSATPLWPLIAIVGAIALVLGIYTLIFRDTSTTTRPTQIENKKEEPRPQTPEPVRTPEPPAQPTPEPPPEPAPTGTAQTPVEPPKPPAVTTPSEQTNTSAAPLSVELSVLEPTWVQILTDGTAAEMAELQPGSTRRYTAQRSVEMKVGNAAGLALKVNERTVPSLGKHGEVRQFTITPENAAQMSFVSPGN